MVVEFGEVWEEEEEERKKMEKGYLLSRLIWGRQSAIQALIRAPALVWDAVLRSGAFTVSVHTLYDCAYERSRSYGTPSCVLIPEGYLCCCHTSAHTSAHAHTGRHPGLWTFCCLHR